MSRCLGGNLWRLQLVDGDDGLGGNSNKHFGDKACDQIFYNCKKQNNRRKQPK